MSSERASSSTHGDASDGEIRKIQRTLDKIPKPYHKNEGFNSLEHVIDILKADDIEGRRKELELDCFEMDAAMEKIVGSTLMKFNYFSRSFGCQRSFLQKQTLFAVFLAPCALLFSLFFGMMLHLLF